MSNSNPTYIQAIRGPVLLMTLGTLLAVDHSGAASFWRTWPALLIIVGLMILADRMTGGPRQ